MPRGDGTGLARRVWRTLVSTVSSPVFCVALAVVLIGDAWAVAVRSARGEFESLFARLVHPSPAGPGVPGQVLGLYIVESTDGPTLMDEAEWYAITERDPTASPVITSNISALFSSEPSGPYRPIGFSREVWIIEQPVGAPDAPPKLDGGMLREVVDDHLMVLFPGGPFHDAIGRSFGSVDVFAKNAIGEYAAHVEDFDVTAAGVTINASFALGWVVLVVSAVAAPVSTARRYRRARGERWARRGRCAVCGYDLAGTEHERCPECGAEAPASGAAC